MKLIKNLKKINKTKLKDICEINLGQSPSSESYTQNESDFPFFQGAADFSYKNTIIRNYTNSPKKIANKDDLLMTVRAPVGRVNFANVDCSIGRGICSFKFKDESLKDYIYFYLNNLYKKNGWNMDIQGAIFDAVNKIQIENKDITIDFQNYEKISIFLNNFENRIINYKKILEKIEIRNNYYADKLLSGELSIENGKISNDKKMFDTIILNDILSTKISSGSTPKNIKNENFEGSINYIKIENIKKGVLNKKYFIDEITNEKMKRSILKENDILITIAGTIGKVFMVSKEHLPANINQAFAIIRVNERYDNDYIFQICKCLDKQISKDKNSGAIQNLNISNISNFEINVFKDIEYQKQISNFLKKIDDEKSKVKRLLELEEKRFEWLSDKLLSGEYIIED